MIVRIREAGSEAWETVEVSSVSLKMGSELTGTVRSDPNEKSSEMLRSGVPLDFEFSRMSDDDADVITISGMNVRSVEIGSGEGYEIPVDEYSFDATGFSITD